jgi:16S rRNA C967 or C1407 C5-methylase (RsmB/RsmF family)/NOL1/NOP2/fmu family ribosome biogenesis protein
MLLPEPLLQSLEGVEGFDREAFQQVHDSGEQVTSIRINAAKFSILNSQFSILNSIPWTEFGYYLEKRPSFTFDPLFHAGCYYVQEASSMFLEQALKQSADLSQPLKVLDLCAAPGGKSTHLQSLISPQSLLVSNEVIKARAGILKQNIIKWGSNNVIVTNNDPKHFARLESFFDVIVVDAPCSGSGLFRRDEGAIQEWSLDAVQLCCGRQQRILVDVLPALKEGGTLIYSTCSYSADEDEAIADWLVEDMGMESIKLKLEEDWGIVETQSLKHEAAGYRFYPDKLKGEGFFLACFKKGGEPEKLRYSSSKWEKVSANEQQVLQQWVNTDGLRFAKHNDRVLALPETLMESFSILQSALYIQYAGTDVGQIIRDKLIPDHALALSPLLTPELTRTELDYEDAIRFLQRQDIQPAAPKGWQVVTYKGYPLGWINALGNRVNNYYPKDLRILKQQNDSGFHK